MAPSRTNPVTRDTLSRNVPPPPSPFAGLSLPPHEFDHFRDCLAAAPLATNPADAHGQLLLASILFGGLLDWRAVACLSKVLTTSSGAGKWYNLAIPIANGQFVLRRWFSDPVTRALLGAAKLPLPAVDDPEAMVKTAAEKLGCTETPDWLMRQARLWWRLRLPAAVADHAEGSFLAGAVPEDNWLRLITGRGQGRPQQQAAQRPPRPNPAPSSQYEPVAFELLFDLADLKQALRAKPAAPFSRYQRRNHVAAALADLQLRTGIGRHVQGWLGVGLHPRPTGGVRGGRPRSPFSPDTLQNYLGLLTPRLLVGMFERRHDMGELAEFYEDWIAEEVDEAAQLRRHKALKQFHGSLVHQAGFPVMQFEVDEDRLMRPAMARLISETEYLAALGLAASRLHEPIRSACRICLILSFRAGLRPIEATSVRVDDVRIESGMVVLTVRPNRIAKAKSPNAQRAVPLHHLLPAAELTELVAFVRAVRERRRSRRRDFLLPVGDGDKLPRAILDVLRQATRDSSVRRYDLRHSFASCAATSLLLPEQAGPVPPDFTSIGFGPECISLERKSRLRAALVGECQAGRAAFFALAALMGHAGPHRSLNHYIHLLDLVLLFYVRDRHDVALPEPALMAPPSAASPDPNPDQALPDWRPLQDVLLRLQAGESVDSVSAQTDVSIALAQRCFERLRAIQSITTGKGTQRHTFARLRDDLGVSVYDKIWHQCTKNGAAVLAKPDVAWALELWLERFDRERSGVPVDDSERQRFVAGLNAMGFDDSHIGVGVSAKGETKRAPWLSWKQDQGPWLPGSNVRLGLVVEIKGRLTAVASLRHCLIMLSIMRQP